LSPQIDTLPYTPTSYSKMSLNCLMSVFIEG
jgi:hypothetical protein